jgi:hypothetical protein
MREDFDGSVINCGRLHFPAFVILLFEGKVIHDICPIQVCILSLQTKLLYYKIMISAPNATHFNLLMKFEVGLN